MKQHQVEQRSPAWHQLRKGKITGTGLKALMGTPRSQEDYFYEILAERQTVGVDDETGGENPMDRGVRLEDEAIATFEFETGKKVTKVGFCEDDGTPEIANSPDGLIGDDEAVEVKCLGGKNHVKFWLTNELPSEYKWQVVQYFIVNPNLKKLYFFAYNPDIPVHPHHLLEVGRAELEEDIELAKKAEQEFVARVNAKLGEIIKL